MRMSCNGCRVLRKGCSENCSIRPCLQWIKSPESQANATVFLAKFYGRAGLMNLINAGPEHLRPAIFRSLLYEACGRIVNPIYGSVGLLWSGSWQLCQSAVEAVLKGSPISKINSEAAASSQGPPLKAYDIRHVSKDDHNSADLHKVRTRCRFKRTSKPKTNNISATTNDDHTLESENQSFRVVFRSGHSDDEVNRSTSHDSTVSHPVEPANMDRESREAGSMVSVETAEGAEPDWVQKHSEEEGADDCVGLDLELTLGFEPLSRAVHVGKEIGGDTCKMELALD